VRKERNESRTTLAYLTAVITKAWSEMAPAQQRAVWQSLSPGQKMQVELAIPEVRTEGVVEGSSTPEQCDECQKGHHSSCTGTFSYHPYKGSPLFTYCCCGKQLSPP
jgi:hypothetical protein